MSDTYPADATATIYLFTFRGKVKTPTVADGRELHNKTAGSPEGIAAARALGDLSHNVYTSAGNGAGSDELLFIDYWNSPRGFGQFFADPQVQAGAEQQFAEREGSSGHRPPASATFISRFPLAHPQPLLACFASE